MPLICFSHNHPIIFFFFFFWTERISCWAWKTWLRFEGELALCACHGIPSGSFLCPGVAGFGTHGAFLLLPPCLCFRLWVDDLCSPHPPTWGAQPPSRGTAVRTKRFRALPGTNTSLGSRGTYVEERENVILVKASIKRKKSQSDNIKYSGSRTIVRFSLGNRAVSYWEVGIRIRPAEFSIPALLLARVAFQKLIHFTKNWFLHL